MELCSRQSRMTTFCVGRARFCAARPRPDLSEIASSPVLMSQRSMSTPSQESTSRPSPLAFTVRMVRLRAVRFLQNNTWMDQSCWYCVVKFSSTVLVQPVSSISKYRSSQRPSKTTTATRSEGPTSELPLHAALPICPELVVCRGEIFQRGVGAAGQFNQQVQIEPAPQQNDHGH